MYPVTINVTDEPPSPTQLDKLRQAAEARVKLNRRIALAAYALLFATIEFAAQHADNPGYALGGVLLIPAIGLALRLALDPGAARTAVSDLQPLTPESDPDAYLRIAAMCATRPVVDSYVRAVAARGRMLCPAEYKAINAWVDGAPNHDKLAAALAAGAALGFPVGGGAPVGDSGPGG